MMAAQGENGRADGGFWAYGLLAFLLFFFSLQHATYDDKLGGHLFEQASLASASDSSLAK